MIAMRTQKSDEKLRTSEILKNAKEAKLKAMVDLSNKIARCEATATEAKQISQLIQDYENETRPTGKKFDLIIDSQTLAAFFDVSVRQTQNWLQHDPPCPQIRRGWWNLKTVLTWWLENINDYKDGPADETFSEHRRNWEKHMAEIARIKAETMKGNLIPREEIIPSWAARLGQVKAMLLNLENRLSHLLVGMDYIGMKKAIHAEVLGIFRAYAATTEYTPELEEIPDDPQYD